MDFSKKFFPLILLQNDKTEYPIISLLNSMLSDTSFDEKSCGNDSLVNSGVFQ